MQSKPYKQTFVTPWEESQPAPLARPIQPMQGMGLPMEIDASPKLLAQAAFSPTRGAQQVDSSVTQAKGTILRSLPAIALSLPVTFGLLGAAWAYGWLAFPGWAAYALTVLALWGGGSVLGYVAIVRTDHSHSAAGVEHRRIDAAENVMLEQIASEERIRREVITTHRELVLRQFGVRDEPKQIR